MPLPILLCARYKGAMNQPPVLVIEDDLDTRDLYCEALEIAGFDAHCVSTGADALAAVAKVRPRVVLLDLSLPDMSGEVFVGELEKQGLRAGLQLILLSGWDDLAEKARALNAAAYLRKPIHLNQLFDLVRRFSDGA